MGNFNFFRKLLKKEKEIFKEVSCVGSDLNHKLQWLQYFVGEAGIEPEDEVKITFHLIRK